MSLLEVLGSAVKTDGTNSVSAEKRLAKSIGKAENLSVAIIEADMTISFMNEEFKALLGMTEASTDPMNVGQLLKHVASLFGESKAREVEMANLSDHINESIAHNQGQSIEHTLFLDNGRSLFIRAFASADGYCLLTVRDNTSERENTEILEIAMHMAGAGYWSIDLQTNTVRLSDSVKSRLTKAELDKIDQHGFWSIVHKDDISAVKAQWEKGVETGSFDFTYRLVLEREGEVWQRSRGRVHFASGGEPLNVLAFVTDKSEDIRKERELILAEQSSKAKSEFLARMSHEIRTPLNAIIGMADAIKDENLSPDALETVQFIDEAAQGLHQLLSQTLDHARLISAKPEAEWEHAEPIKVVEDCVRLWRPQCSKKGLKLKVFHGKDLPEAMLMDSFKLGQCLNNLLSNAAKFTHAGEISVIIKRTPYKGQDSLLIAVRDTGIGMSAKATSTVFDEFTQADTSINREYGGTGLGMNITQRLVQVMDGRITVSSEEGKGSTFIIILPIREVAEDVEPVMDVMTAADLVMPASIDSVVQAKVVAEMSMRTPEADKEYPPFSGLSVLCVEDNPVNQHVVRKLIGKRVDQLHFANNGREALEALTTVQVDIVLMDIHMPVMDGIEATLAIRNSDSAWANVIIIALTADPDYQQARICRNLGMNGTIAKPVTREDIACAFENAISDIGTTYGQKVTLEPQRKAG